MSQRTRSWGRGTSAIVRTLVSAARPVTQVELAATVGVSQPRVSQVLASLSNEGAVERTSYGYVGNISLLVDLYLARHRPSTIGHDQPWYSLAPIPQQLRQACDTASTQGIPVAVSADYATELTSAWRHPTLTVIYSASQYDLSAAGFVRAESRGDSTVLLRATSDTNFLDDAGSDAEMPLVHPLQQIWDLVDLGGEDRLEAADRLKHEFLRSQSLAAL